MIDIKNAKTSELVEFYNENAEAIGRKQITKFASRPIAERRVEEVVELLREQNKEAPVVGGYAHCPNCGAHLENGWGDLEHMAETSNRECAIEAMGGHEFICLGCLKGFGEKIHHAAPTTKNERRAAGIRESWKNPEVAAKRARRNGVRVTTGLDTAHEVTSEYRSLKQAFEALDFPLSAHIRFRMELKAAGTLEQFGARWEIIEG